MRQHRIVLLAGDGIGPEISSVAKQLLKAVSEKSNFRLIIDEMPFGGTAIDISGTPLPETTLDACKEADAILLAAIGDPKYDSLPRHQRPETGLLALRSGLGLFANIRPIKAWPALIEASTLKPEIITDVDLIVVRELTGGIYFGEPKGIIKTNSSERAFNTMTYTSDEIDRIANIAFELAKGRKGSVCSVDKANVLDVSQLWRNRVTELAKNNPNIQLQHLYVDNAAMQLIREPKVFDIILTGNLFGDILSDEAAMLTGSIGMLPSASLSSSGPGLFEPVHGSAPDIAGLNIANPLAMILSAAMMLRIGLREEEAAETLENAVDKVLNKGFRTSDLMSSGMKEVGCEEMGLKVLEAL